MEELNRVSGRVVDGAIRIHRALGPGLMESVYEAVLARDLRAKGLYVERLAPVHKKQLLTYLKLLDYRLGLLLNFGAPLMKDGIKRIINGY